MRRLLVRCEIGKHPVSSQIVTVRQGTEAARELDTQFKAAS